jgi:hypothetical protein
MTTMMQAAPGQGGPFPSTRGLAREIRAATARSRLRDYLDAVAEQLHAAGFLATIDVEPGRFLDAQITVTHLPDRAAGDAAGDYYPCATGAAAGGVAGGAVVGSGLGAPVTARLAWAEDIGWSASHPGIRSGTTPWR